MKHVITSHIAMCPEQVFLAAMATPSSDILQYESKIWATADLLRGVGIRESDFPKYMMPFFALVLVESRLLRHARELEAEIGRDDLDAFVEEFTDNNLGYNDLVIREEITLAQVCENDKNFETDFDAYLRAFDVETRYLLGVGAGNEDEKYLDIAGICNLLRKKRVLFATVKAWSSIDLVPFNNSEITTLEEHIKRRWADISAETAGEQYTPEDIIALISDIIASKLEDNEQFLTIYDGTCGGGNLLFGVEDKINARFPGRHTATYGQDWNDALYALARIESRFRKDSYIEYGNTLTSYGKFHGKRFDVAVANPPYGVDWKGFKKEIYGDQTQRFPHVPSTSDGQFLFTQHFLSMLGPEGLAVIVHNGSTLFSGDAGSGESEIRKRFLDNDWVEALIQMPTDEFFNTGIYTYLWVFNKNKPQKRKDKVIVINGSEQYEGLKKSRGKKRKQMAETHRAAITGALVDFKDSDIARVFDKWHFYYNKQEIRLTHLDEAGHSFEARLPFTLRRNGEWTRDQEWPLQPTAIVQEGDFPVDIRNMVIWKKPAGSKAADLRTYMEDELRPLLNTLDAREYPLRVECDPAPSRLRSMDGQGVEVPVLSARLPDRQGVEVPVLSGVEVWHFDRDRETLVCTVGGISEDMGCGNIAVKATYKAATKRTPEHVQITCVLTPHYEKDHEIIPYDPNPEANEANIRAFMDEYVFLPFIYLDNTVGVEINFNKVFYEPEQVESVEEVTNELEKLDNELKRLEGELNL